MRRPQPVTTLSDGVSVAKPAAKLSKPEKNVRKPRATTRSRGACPRDMLQSRPLLHLLTPTDVTRLSIPTIPLCIRGPDLDVIRERDDVSQQHARSNEDLRAMENKLIDVEDLY